MSTRVNGEDTGQTMQLGDDIHKHYRVQSDPIQHICCMDVTLYLLCLNQLYRQAVHGLCWLHTGKNTILNLCLRTQ